MKRIWLVALSILTSLSWTCLAKIPDKDAEKMDKNEAFVAKVTDYIVDGEISTALRRGSVTTLVFDKLQIEIVSPKTLAGKRVWVSVLSNKDVWRKIRGQIRFVSNLSYLDGSRPHFRIGDGALNDVFFESVGKYLCDIVPVMPKWGCDSPCAIIQ